jgi:hypothetical protein
MKRNASEKCDNCCIKWILAILLLGITVVHLIVLEILLWSVAIAIVCSLPKIGKATGNSTSIVPSTGSRKV